MNSNEERGSALTQNSRLPTSPAFLDRIGSIKIGEGSVLADIRKARLLRGFELPEKAKPTYGERTCD